MDERTINELVQFESEVELLEGIIPTNDPSRSSFNVCECGTRYSKVLGWITAPYCATCHLEKRHKVVLPVDQQELLPAINPAYIPEPIQQRMTTVPKIPLPTNLSPRDKKIQLVLRTELKVDGMVVYDSKTLIEAINNQLNPTRGKLYDETMTPAIVARNPNSLKKISGLAAALEDPEKL